jgi:hypothetical protein
MLGDAVANSVLGVQKQSISQLTASAAKFAEDVLLHGFKHYRGRPLNGIWATAPYLHNGSVATLEELLKLDTTRQTSFMVGCQDYDPATLGFKTTCADGATFSVGPKDGGNGNHGHNFGTGLKPEEKTALINYLKTL